MKKMFLICSLALAAAGLGTWLTEPDMHSEVPVIYWATDPNPARIEQVDKFHQWLVENGHTTAEGKPVVELRLETVSADRKGVIQGVSGVAADIMDCNIPWYQSIGLLADVTEEAARYGFGIDHTYQALEPLLSVDGRQYGFPCNVNVMGLWVNVDNFEKLGMPPPPTRWDWETFERIGRQFVEHANPPGERQTVFFTNRIEHSYMLRALHCSLGASEFNETLTRCGLGHEGWAAIGSALILVSATGVNRWPDIEIRPKWFGVVFSPAGRAEQPAPGSIQTDPGVGLRKTVQPAWCHRDV